MDNEEVTGNEIIGGRRHVNARIEVQSYETGRNNK